MSDFYKHKQLERANIEINVLDEAMKNIQKIKIDYQKIYKWDIVKREIMDEAFNLVIDELTEMIEQTETFTR